MANKKFDARSILGFVFAFVLLVTPFVPVSAYSLIYGYGFNTRWLTVRNYSSYNSIVTISTNDWYLSSDVKPSICNSCSSFQVSVNNSTALPAGVNGQTWTYSNGSNIYFAYIRLNNNSGYFPSFPTNLKRNIIGHELGHAWGLNHSSYNSALLWYSDANYFNYGVYTPQSDDINGVNRLY